jgi:hypothetical protein
MPVLKDSTNARRKYAFEVTYNQGATYSSRTKKAVFIYADNDLDAFTISCEIPWYQGLNYSQAPVVTMASIENPERTVK